jgi:hypothetical protein
MKHGLLKRFAEVAAATSSPWFPCGMVAIAVVTISALPNISFGAAADQAHDKQFSMIMGQGVAVCEAYLDLLKASGKSLPAGHGLDFV